MFKNNLKHTHGFNFIVIIASFSSHNKIKIITETILVGKGLKQQQQKTTNRVDESFKNLKRKNSRSCYETTTRTTTKKNQ